MANPNDRIVFRNENGDWVNKKLDSERASSLHSTQKSAEDAAREMIRNQGGGELITKGLDGKIRSKDTIAPGNDPPSIRDKEN